MWSVLISSSPGVRLTIDQHYLKFPWLWFSSLSQRRRRADASTSNTWCRLTSRWPPSPPLACWVSSCLRVTSIWTKWKVLLLLKEKELCPFDAIQPYSTALWDIDSSLCFIKFNFDFNFNRFILSWLDESCSEQRRGGKWAKITRHEGKCARDGRS